MGGKDCTISQKRKKGNIAYRQSMLVEGRTIEHHSSQIDDETTGKAQSTKTSRGYPLQTCCPLLGNTQWGHHPLFFFPLGAYPVRHSKPNFDRITLACIDSVQ